MWFAFAFWWSCCTSPWLPAQHRFLLSHKKNSIMLLRYSRSLTREARESRSAWEAWAGEVCGKCAEMWKQMASTKDHLLVPLQGIRSIKATKQLLALGLDLGWGVRTCSGEKKPEPFAATLHLHPCSPRTTYMAFYHGGKAKPVQLLGSKSLMHGGGRHSLVTKSWEVWQSEYTDVKWQVEVKHFVPCWSGIRHTCTCFDPHWACRRDR